MKRICQVAVTSGLLFLGSSWSPAAAPPPRRVLVEAETAFALDLYAQLKARPGNLFFSPYSISTALAMTSTGARGATEKQMNQVLHLEASQGSVHSSFAELQNQLNEAGKQDGIELNVANAVWGQQGHPFLPAFLKTVREEYSANIHQADFATAAESARSDINRWVAQQTKDKILDILPPGSINRATRLVLANAIYFKGLWAKQYKKAETTTQPFHLAGGRQGQAALMHHLDEVRYVENSQFQAVELPYKGGQLSMLVLLPRQTDGCADLENRLTPALVSQSLNQMKQQKVEIFLPRFKLESGFNLNQTLESMGMVDAFGPKADFSGMDGTNDLYISDVFHKAWGEVNEEGTEAAAATTVVARLASVAKPQLPTPVFRADHPFLFLVRDARAGTVLFIGRLSDPS